MKKNKFVYAIYRHYDDIKRGDIAYAETNFNELVFSKKEALTYNYFDYREKEDVIHSHIVYKINFSLIEAEMKKQNVTDIKDLDQEFIENNEWCEDNKCEVLFDSSQRALAKAGIF